MVMLVTVKFGATEYENADAILQKPSDMLKMITYSSF